MPTLDMIERVVTAHDHKPISRDVAPRRAAVAVVLRESAGAAEVLLMKRTVREGDRWSGQVSFPGGREEPGDGSLLDTARRETNEEVAVDLAVDARAIGQLDPMQARSRGGLAGLSVWPFVFFATADLIPSTSIEAESTFWLPLADVLSGQLDDIYPYRLGVAGRIDLPCWKYQGYTVWGMTHKMLSDFLSLIRAG